MVKADWPLDHRPQMKDFARSIYLKIRNQFGKDYNKYIEESHCLPTNVLQ